ncbi:hypothetical protein CDAR_280761 [Caerostris darwini]|uniref:Uncharacterized protein n=1 Tax=Caerostris darwini TaxID=1538125 RepID=A0AAV4MDZ4_9ARAC|nr:hypothetical protein CDAR_280761 [Caerostris darwini]
MAKIGKRLAGILQAVMFVAIFSMHELSNPDNSDPDNYLRYYTSKGNSYNYEDPVIDYLRYYISKGNPYNSDNQRDLDPNYLKYYTFKDPSLFKSNQIHYRGNYPTLFISSAVKSSEIGFNISCASTSRAGGCSKVSKIKVWDYETDETVAERASSGIKGGDYYMQTVDPYLYRLSKPSYEVTYKRVTLPYQMYDNRKSSRRNARKGYHLSDVHEDLLPWEGMSNSEEEEALKKEVKYKNVTLPRQRYDNKRNSKGYARKAAPPEEGGVDYAVRDFDAENYPRVGANRSVGGRFSGRGGRIRSEGRFGSKTNRASDDRYGKIRRIIDYEYEYELVPRLDYMGTSNSNPEIVPEPSFGNIGYTPRLNTERQPSTVVKRFRRHMKSSRKFSYPQVIKQLPAGSLKNKEVISAADGSLVTYNKYNITGNIFSKHEISNDTLLSMFEKESNNTNISRKVMNSTIKSNYTDIGV